MGEFLYACIVILQLGLHYLGLIAIILGAVAFVFQNFDRGTELIVSGIGFLVLKYVIGIVYITVLKIAKSPD